MTKTVVRQIIFRNVKRYVIAVLGLTRKEVLLGHDYFVLGPHNAGTIVEFNGHGFERGYVDINLPNQLACVFLGCCKSLVEQMVAVDFVKALLVFQLLDC